MFNTISKDTKQNSNMKDNNNASSIKTQNNCSSSKNPNNDNNNSIQATKNFFGVDNNNNSNANENKKYLFASIPSSEINSNNISKSVNKVNFNVTKKTNKNFQNNNNNNNNHNNLNNNNNNINLCFKTKMFTSTVSNNDGLNNNKLNNNSSNNNNNNMNLNSHKKINFIPNNFNNNFNNNNNLFYNNQNYNKNINNNNNNKINYNIPIINTENNYVIPFNQQMLTILYSSYFPNKNDSVNFFKNPNIIFAKNINNESNSNNDNNINNNINKDNNITNNQLKTPKFKDNYIDLLINSVDNLISNGLNINSLKSFSKHSYNNSYSNHSHLNIKRIRSSSDNNNNNNNFITENKKKCENKICPVTFSKTSVYHKIHPYFYNNISSLYLCEDCYVAYKEGQYCYYCGVIYRKYKGKKGFNEHKVWISCDYCENWEHVLCEEKYGKYSNITNLLKDSNFKYKCPICLKKEKESSKSKNYNKTSDVTENDDFSDINYKNNNNKKKKIDKNKNKNHSSNNNNNNNNRRKNSNFNNILDNNFILNKKEKFSEKYYDLKQIFKFEDDDINK